MPVAKTLHYIWHWNEKDLRTRQPAGSGKSTAVEIALDEAVKTGAHVGLACPAGMLATRHRARHASAAQLVSVFPVMTNICRFSLP